MSAHTQDCSARVYGERVTDWPCCRPGKHIEDGQWWCWQHLPSAVAKRQKARDAKDAEWIRTQKLHGQRQKQERTAYEHTYAKSMEPKAMEAVRDALAASETWLLRITDEILDGEGCRPAYSEHMERVRAALAAARLPGKVRP